MGIKIGFNNFRQFKDFGPVELGDITFLVGPNNSGKSSLTKALLLLSSYLYSTELKTFRFTHPDLKGSETLTFSRIKTKSAARNQLQFFLERDRRSVIIKLVGNEESDFCSVKYLRIVDHRFNFLLNFDFFKNEVTITKSKESALGMLDLIGDNNVAKVMSVLFENTQHNMEEYLSVEGDLHKELNDTFSFHFDNGMHRYENGDINEYVCDLLNFVSYELFSYFMKLTQADRNDNNEYQEYLRLYLNSSLILDGVREVQNIIKSCKLAFWEFNTSTHNNSISIFDKDEQSSGVINEYFKKTDSTKTRTDEFIRKWIQVFQIGKDFQMQKLASQFYQIRVFNGNWVDLSDYGKGSYRVYMLLLKIAIVANMNDSETFTLIVEEPEIHLHPALQSKLADLFHDAYTQFGIHFIVETHSEYLIRKTQIIVKEMGYGDTKRQNPFSVIYFDKNQKQWNMEYREDGKFKQTFGSGFYDEASDLTLNLL